MLREFSSLLLLFLDEVAQSGNISIQYLPELLATHHLYQGLLVGIGDLGELLEILKVFLLSLEVVSQALHVF